MFHLDQEVYLQLQSMLPRISLLGVMLNAQENAFSCISAVLNVCDDTIDVFVAAEPTFHFIHSKGVLQSIAYRLFLLMYDSGISDLTKRTFIDILGTKLPYHTNSQTMQLTIHLYLCLGLHKSAAQTIVHIKQWHHLIHGATYIHLHGTMENTKRGARWCSFVSLGCGFAVSLNRDTYSIFLKLIL